MTVTALLAGASGLALRVSELGQYVPAQGSAAVTDPDDGSGATVTDATSAVATVG